MGSPKTVDRNAMTFVPIGWNVVLWGVKTRLELRQGIGEDGKAEEVANRMRGKRYKVQKRLQNSQSYQHQERCKRILEETTRIDRDSLDFFSRWHQPRRSRQEGGPSRSQTGDAP